CNADDMLKEGKEAAALAKHAAALAAYERALACKHDMHTVQLAFMEACNSLDVAKAKQYWNQLPPDIQANAKQICIRNNISEAQLAGTCDFDALAKAAENSVALGQHADALKHYEEALACRQDKHTLQFAFMEACNAYNIPKAQQYWNQVSSDVQD